MNKTISISKEKIQNLTGLRISDTEFEKLSSEIEIYLTDGLYQYMDSKTQNVLEQLLKMMYWKTKGNEFEYLKQCSISTFTGLDVYDVFNEYMDRNPSEEELRSISNRFPDALNEVSDWITIIQELIEIEL